MAEDITPLLRVTALKVHFPVAGEGFDASKSVVKAVDGVSFDVSEGERWPLWTNRAAENRRPARPSWA